MNIAYTDLGLLVFPDYNELHPYTKSEAVQEYRNAFSDTEEANKGIAVNGANQYTYSFADYLYNLRENCYGLATTDYAVPFLQMVVSGYIPYSTEGAGNLSYDLQTQKLKWIEFGSLPYFYLTHESAVNLRDSYNSTLFSSTWADWKDIVVDTYNEFNENFGKLYGKQMVEHKILAHEVARVTYEDGTKVYVNYTDSEVKADGITIPAKDYVVTGGNR